MNKIIPIGIIIIVIVIIIGALAYQTTVNKNVSNNMTNMSNMTSANSSTNGLQATVKVENGTFNPTTLTVQPGTTVTWIVNDTSNTKYMITSNQTNLFMSNNLTNGQSFSFQFNQTGNYSYYDMDSMSNMGPNGIIIVQ